MFGKNSFASLKPVALGLNVSPSTYGTTIPRVLGRIRGSLYLIWAQNLLQANQKGGNKGPYSYTQSGDWLLAHNPILNVLQMWSAGAGGSNALYDLVDMTYQTIYTGYPQSVIVPDPQCYTIIGVTVTMPYAVILSDYAGIGYTGPVVQNLSGSYEIPLWNIALTGPDPTNPSALRNAPFTYSASLDEVVLGQLPSSLIGQTITVYYVDLPATQDQPPSQQLGMYFEEVLGAGGEYTEQANFSGQQIQYPFFAGIGGAYVYCGISAIFPNTLAEMQGMGIYPTGDLDFVDMFEDVFKSGFVQPAQFAFASGGGLTRWQPGIPYPLGSCVLTPDSYLQYATVPGVSSLTEPTWPSPGYTIGQLTTDGTSPTQITWFDCGFYNGISPSSPPFEGSGMPPEVFGLYSKLQTGLGCFDFPSIVQAYIGSAADAAETGTWTNLALSTSGGYVGQWPYNLPNAPGSTLLLFTDSSVSPAPLYTIANTAVLTIPTPNVFTDVATMASPSGGVQDLYAALVKSTYKGVSVVGTHGPVNQAFLLEVGGLDTVGTPVTASGTTVNPTASITTVNNPGEPCLILAFINAAAIGVIADQDWTHWKTIMGPSTNHVVVLERLVYYPGTYTLPPGAVTVTANWTVVLLPLTNSQPPDYPKPFGDFIDLPSLEICRTQGRANGLWGSINMDHQESASDWLKKICSAGVMAPVWSGWKMKLKALSEVSTVGNGATYIAPTAAGPVMDIPENALIGDDKTPPTQVTRKARLHLPNLLRVSIPDRETEYNTNEVGQPFTPAIAQLGVRQAAPTDLPCVTSATVANMILGILVRRQNLLRNVYKQKVKPQAAKLLEPADLVTINDSQLGIVGLPVRVVSIAEDDKFNLDIEYEDFFYGLNSPTPIPTTVHTGGGTPTNGNPGFINTPIIFESVPLPGMLAGVNYIMFLLSGASPDYGGANVWVSYDGGVTYGVIGNANGNAAMGVLTADLPAADDPDVVDSVLVNLTESLGVLQSFTTVQENLFESVCYVDTGGAGPLGNIALSTVIAGGSGYAVGDTGTVDGGSTLATYIITFVSSGVVAGYTITSGGAGYTVTSPATTTTGGAQPGVGVGFEIAILEIGPIIPYELIGYNTATLGSAYMYTLPEPIRRGLYGAPAAGVGMDHPIGSNFAFIPSGAEGIGSPGGAGKFIWAYPPQYIGVLLYFKFPAYNTFGNELQDLSLVPAYPFTPMGVAQGVSPSYTLTPYVPLYQAWILGQDTFVRANSNPISGGPDGPWVQLSAASGFGPAQIVSDQVTSATANVNADSWMNTNYFGGAWPADQWAMITVNACANDSYIGVSLRQNITGTATAYRLFWNGTLGSPGTAYIQSVIAGVFNTINSVALTVNPGDTLMGAVQTSGGQTDLYLFQNGTLVLDAVDNNIVSGAAGFMCNPVTATTDTALSAFSAGQYYDISMLQTSVMFPTGTVNYNARNFPILIPAIGGTRYYVTIYDPTFTGDTGSETNLTAYCETSPSKVGSRGYTYMGFIDAVIAGIGSPCAGGWPVPPCQPV